MHLDALMDQKITAVPSAPPSPRIHRRRALGLLFGGAAACAADAFWIEPGRLSVTRESILCPRLPAALDGLRVGVMADFHFKPDQDGPLVKAAVERLNLEKPDLIALPGDFIDADPAVLDPLLDLLKHLAPAHGVFASMGNHDGWTGKASLIRKGFEKAGIPLLVNRHSALRIRGETLAIAATDHIWLGKPDPAKTLRGIRPQTPVIALVHEPDYFDDLTRHRPVQLQLSGHTHGGQCRVPVLGYAPAKVKLGEKYIHGCYERGDSRLFVTRGMGTTGLRVRFACPPEIGLLTLRSAEPA